MFEISSMISLFTNIDPKSACSASILDGKLFSLEILMLSIFVLFTNVELN